MGTGTTRTDPGFVIKILVLDPGPVPFSPDSPFTFAFAFKAIDSGLIDILHTCLSGFTIIDTRSGIVAVVVAAAVLDEEG